LACPGTTGEEVIEASDAAGLDRKVSTIPRALLSQIEEVMWSRGGRLSRTERTRVWRKALKLVTRTG
jgi:hypothetical protein